MQTFKLTLAYEGTPFVGWQRQAEGTSIQGLLEAILSDLAGSAVAIAGAGRTDAGVHALAQVCSCAFDTALTPDTLRRALNARLPAAVRVLDAVPVPETFHARFSARGKRYRYLIANGPTVSPFAAQYAWHITGRLELEPMRQAAAALVGTYDFAAFQSTGTELAHGVRTVSEATVGDVTAMPPAPLFAGAVPGGRIVAFEVCADGFLRHMVRAMAGTLVEVGLGRRHPRLEALIAGADRSQAGPTAPAHGLWLVEVIY